MTGNMRFPEPIGRGVGRYGRWVTIAAVILAVTAFFPRSPVVETLTGQSVTDAELALSPAYLLTSPIGAFFDHLTLVTDRQHIAILIGWVVLFLAWRAWRIAAGGRRSAVLADPLVGGQSRDAGIGVRPRGFVRAALHEALVAAGSLAALLAVYAFGVLSPRPMAALRALDPDLVIVDFHAHTEASHDGRAGLGIDDRRRWNEGAGFDVVYVTDHLRASSTVDPALVVLGGMAGNPARAGDGLSVLPGRELVWKRQHIIVLGLADPVTGVPEDEPWPVLIQTIPNDLSRVPLPEGRERVHAIELMDGDPRGFRQSMEERDRILALSDSLSLVPIAASNHHGWGTAAAAWTLMRLPGWQELDPEEVGARIEDRLRAGNYAAGAGTDGPSADVRVVERPRLPGGTGSEGALLAATTFPRFFWHILTGLTLAERLVWLGWVVALAGVRAAVGARTIAPPVPNR